MQSPWGSVSVSGSKIVRFANLDRRPPPLLEATLLVRLLQRESVFAGTLREVGAAGVREPVVIWCVAGLCRGRLELLRTDGEVIPVPVTLLGRLAGWGLVHRDINGVPPKSAKLPRGAFDIKPHPGKSRPSSPLCGAMLSMRNAVWKSGPTRMASCAAGCARSRLGLGLHGISVAQHTWLPVEFPELGHVHYADASLGWFRVAERAPAPRKVDVASAALDQLHLEPDAVLVAGGVPATGTRHPHNHHATSPACSWTRGRSTLSSCVNAKSSATRSVPGPCCRPTRRTVIPGAKNWMRPCGTSWACRRSCWTIWLSYVTSRLLKNAVG